MCIYYFGIPAIHTQIVLNKHQTVSIIEILSAFCCFTVNLQQPWLIYNSNY